MNVVRFLPPSFFSRKKLSAINGAMHFVPFLQVLGFLSSGIRMSIKNPHIFMMLWTLVLLATCTIASIPSTCIEMDSLRSQTTTLTAYKVKQQPIIALTRSFYSDLFLWFDQRALFDVLLSSFICTFRSSFLLLFNSAIRCITLKLHTDNCCHFFLVLLSLTCKS